MRARSESTTRRRLVRLDAPINWVWIVGFALRLGLACFVAGGALYLLLRHREVRAYAEYAYGGPAEVLLVPVQGVAPSALKSSWGDPRSGGRTHEGIDIFAPRGTPVVAAASGALIRIGSDRLGGNIVWIAGAGGQLYYYAHLDRFAPGLKTGMAVPAGFVLGKVGTTGNARGTPPHLHFGIYPSGNAFRAIDPAPLLRSRKPSPPPALVFVAS